VYNETKKQSVTASCRGKRKVKVIKRCLTMLVFASLMIVVCGFLLRAKQEPLTSEEVTKALQIPYQVENVPSKTKKRPGIERQIKYIVIHNTANTESSAQNERDYLVNENNTTSTSFNIVVDDHEIIEAIPVTEVAFHAGTWEGNQKGIGIEICESGNYGQAEANAAKLTAYLMKKYHLSIEDVKTHHDFSGKDCPRKILDHWETFIADVEKNYQSLS